MGVGTSCTVVGLGELSKLFPMSIAGAEEGKIADMIRFSSEIEPLVRRIEKAPREKCVSVLIEQLKRGLSYRRFMAALFLATIRKGNSHHEVYAIHSAHQMSLDANPEDRLLPLFWALDSYKRAQDEFPSAALPELRGKLPEAERAIDEFDLAMRELDAERSEGAVIAVARSMGLQQTMQRLWHYAARDWGFIGHKAIAVANCWRVVQTIGPKYSEPMLRFVIHQLYSPYGREDLQRQSYFSNLERAEKHVKRLAPDWTTARPNREATLALLSPMREGKVGPACGLAMTQLARNRAAAGAIWDSVHLLAAEHIIRSVDNRLGTRPLHATTTANALHYAFLSSTSRQDQLMILLQAVGWMTESYRVTDSRKLMRKGSITELVPAEIPETSSDAVDEIFSLLSTDAPFPADQVKSPNPSSALQRDKAAPRALALFQKSPDAQEFHQTARRATFLKSSFNAHNFKFPTAIFEDAELVTPTWRPYLLAASVHWLYGAQSADAPIIQEAREALKTL